MYDVQLRIDTTPDRVFAVLADGWMYAGWVVGATHMRDVDATWPAVGARIHHSVGAWPLRVQDTSSVLAVEPDRLLELHVRLWPFGAGRVRLTLEPDGDGTLATMGEELTDGVGRLIPEVAVGPLIGVRNKESLLRLSDIATRRYAAHG